MRFQIFRKNVLAARSDEEIVRAIKDALAMVKTDELAKLPEEAQDVLVHKPTDLHSSAVTLLHCDLAHRGEPERGDLLRQLAELYASASVRLSMIEHRRI